jgi:hypothetical protein
MGWFKNGIIPPGVLELPPLNQLPPEDPRYPLKYAGGIGIDTGVVLSTGWVSDTTDPYQEPGQGDGVEGPNNGAERSNVLNSAGSVTGTDIDLDFAEMVYPGRDVFGGDPTVLVFQVTFTTPGYVRASYVWATDEFPAFLQETVNEVFNDSFAILIKNGDLQSTNDYELLAKFTMFGAWNCGDPFFKMNQVAHVPSSLLEALHAIPKEPIWENSIISFPNRADLDVPNYDHEFGGFTKVSTNETSDRLGPGTYTIKIVVQDVFDKQVDSALFLPKHSVKFFDVLAADFDGDGDVDGDDFLIWQSGFGNPEADHWSEGDADFDGDVDGDDFLIWQNQFKSEGNADKWRADFDRDGDVDGDDFLIWQQWNGMESCATRFDGDADGNEKVNGDDFLIWQSEFGEGSGGGGSKGGESATGGDGPTAAAASAEEAIADSTFSTDFNGDGAINAADVAVLTSHSGFDSEASRADDDVNGDGRFDAADLLAWEDGDVSTGNETSLTGQIIEAIFYYNQVFGVGTIPEWLLDSE